MMKAKKQQQQQQQKSKLREQNTRKLWCDKTIVESGFAAREQR